MKIAALGLLLMCGGCSLYFGSSESPPPDAGYPWWPDALVYPPPPPPPPDAQPVPPDAPCDGAPTTPGPGTCPGARVEVFAVYEASSNHAAAGRASVKLEHPGAYRLVLSSYEETHWHVALAPGATVEAVYLYGYDAQTVDLRNVPVTTHTNASGDFACGYSYPYDGMGCDTNLLLARVDTEAGALHAFHGCYHASSWTLHRDDKVTSNCDTASGYVQYDFTAQTCKPTP